MPSLYILDVEEFASIATIARQGAGVTERKLGSYLEFSTDGELSIDRRATGARHAVWYSCIGGVRGGRIVQFDKDQLRLIPDGNDLGQP
jgi:hypothetical protein